MQAQQQRQETARPGWAREAGEDGTAPWGVSRNRKRAGLLTTSTSADVYSEAEPLGGFCIRRSLTPRGAPGEGIALLPPAGSSSTVPAGDSGPCLEHSSGMRLRRNRGRLGRSVDQRLA